MKEQQKRIGSAEFRNTQFSYQLGEDGVEQFVVTPELQIDPVYNAISVVELAIEKGGEILLVPVSARRQLIDLSDDMATRVAILYDADARDALVKALDD